MHPHIIHEKETLFELGTIENNIIHYDFDKIVGYLNYKGRLTFGKNFKIYEDDMFLLYKLCLYFIRDYKNCEKYGLDPHKGILLSGPVGCGKTSWMKLLKHISPNVINYEVIPSRFLTFQFNSKGFEVIEKYGSGFSFCFDDLGVEPDGKHFGQDCNVMGEILLSRYDLFIQNKKLTFATTNLNAEEIDERYGSRVRSRMRQLFNLVAFDKNCRDKR
ncbi:P-loop NTPase family protein [Wenyingzhuangia marina]|uniref:DNA replication protein DnaC n=1 Tax=Wenyingzhuangia marina TaxID=1195760 RepID=A0A1M5VBP3_9FLAO|nr:ATPase [Wenyingzhuangia marina]GGF73129.1 ATPase [Wenyingzhuangia marina]SHH72702.1 hypothetical protein SAMN05444281_1680 [Wenyingzhuangia marina]